MIIAIICGGRSVEHKVSLQSAVSIAKYLGFSSHQVLMVGFTEEGRFVSHKDLILDQHDPIKIRLNDEAREVKFGFQSIDDKKVDVCFSVIHGTGGEDGNIQGFLNIYQLPFVGADTKTSALGMDKHFTKMILESKKIPVTNYEVIYPHRRAPSYQSLISKLGATMLVKPANLGSSVGISKCNDENSFKQALALAISYDSKVLVEKFIDGKEIEVAVLGHPGELIISSPSEIITNHSFYSYQAKYIDKGSTKTLISANIDAKVKKVITGLAGDIYEVLDCRGLARLDFLFSTADGVVFNEINTMPGFTDISMYPKMMVASGISYPELLDRLLKLALSYDLAQKSKTTRPPQ
ncbi:MAG: D-alanine--D-alanine ligase [SAR324 cluster bacterium]|nr:D-alanine--D-alanine ligase [SAR324 cluster bacterium]